MSNSSNFIFKALYIIAWIIFVGLSIEAGGLIVNFVFSVYKPEFVPHLYQKLDLSAMYNRSQWAFFGMYTFILAIAMLKAWLFYVVIELVGKLDLAKPFSTFVSKKIMLISILTLDIGVLSLVARQSAKNLLHHGYETDELNRFWVDGEAYILMAAVVYIIAIIFKKGIELQNENDLTI